MEPATKPAPLVLPFKHQHVRLASPRHVHRAPSLQHLLRALPTSKTLESEIRQVRIGAHENHLPFTALVFFHYGCNSLCRFSDFFVSCGNRSDFHRLGTGSGLDRDIPSVDSAEQQAVLAPITQLFDGMAKRDAAAIKKPLLSGGTMVLMRDGKPTLMTFEDFANRLGKPGTTQIQERIHDPLVRIDNDLAVVWAPFEFLVDGKVDHCGTDLFNVVRADGQWVIASVADTGRKDCVRK